MHMELKKITHAQIAGKVKANAGTNHYDGFASGLFLARVAMFRVVMLRVVMLQVAMLRLAMLRITTLWITMLRVAMLLLAVLRVAKLRISTLRVTMLRLAMLAPLFLLNFIIPEASVAQGVQIDGLTSNPDDKVEVRTSAGLDGELESHSGGFVTRSGFDVLYGNDGTNIRLKMTLAYQLTERFSGGIGVGYVFYHDPADLVPVYFDVIYHLGEGDITPYAQLKTGYSFSIFRNEDIMADRHRGGFLLNPALGLQARGQNGRGAYFSAGFNLDETSWDHEIFGNRIITEKISYRRISFGFGFIF